MTASDAVKASDGFAVSSGYVVDKCVGRGVNASGIIVGDGENLQIEVGGGGDGLAHLGASGGCIVKELEVVEERMLGIIGNRGLEEHEVGEGREVAAQGVVFHATLFNAAEAEVEILVPDAAAELAGGHERESGLELALDKRGYCTVFGAAHLGGVDAACIESVAGLNEFGGGQEAAHDVEFVGKRTFTHNRNVRLNYL